MAVRRQYRSSSYSAALSIFIIILFNYKTRILTSTLQEACENVEEMERSLSSYDCKGLYWFLSQDKGIRRHLGVGGLNGFFLQHKKSLHAFCISLILLSGDMCAYTLGPPRNPCGKCKKGVRSNQKGICCAQGVDLAYLQTGISRVFFWVLNFENLYSSGYCSQLLHFLGVAR